MIVSVTPVTPVRDRTRDEVATAPVHKPIDSKVRGFVLERMSHAKGGLLPSASAPQIIFGLLPGFESGKIAPKEKRKSKLRRTPLVRRVPIGLTPVDPEGWLNAFMQFILYVPGFAEAFSFAPRSWYPIQEFIDQYHHDQQENRSLSSANGAALYRFLSFKLPHFTMQEMCETFIRTLHTKWEIHHSIHEALKTVGASDLFVTESVLKKQIFSGPNLCYDLDAFIERRPDGGNVNYIAYVKIEGSWYQCDDERITQFRSDSLSLALQRAALSHYKRISLGKPTSYFL